LLGLTFEQALRVDRPPGSYTWRFKLSACHSRAALGPRPRNGLNLISDDLHHELKGKALE
jgi:hypothetical protein